jgi:hypothetical protein
MERLEGDKSLKIPVTPSGIDAGTVRLVAQRLNHYASPGPNLKFVLTVNDEAVKFLMCCINLEKRVLQWADCYAVFFASKCRISIMMLGVNRKVCLEISLTVTVKVSGTAGTLQILRKSVNFVKLSQTFDSLGRNYGNI